MYKESEAGSSAPFTFSVDSLLLQTLSNIAHPLELALSVFANSQYFGVSGQGGVSQVSDCVLSAPLKSGQGRKRFLIYSFLCPIGPVWKGQLFT